MAKGKAVKAKALKRNVKKQGIYRKMKAERNIKGNFAKSKGDTVLQEEMKMIDYSAERLNQSFKNSGVYYDRQGDFKPKATVKEDDK